MMMGSCSQGSRRRTSRKRSTRRSDNGQRTTDQVRRFRRSTHESPPPHPNPLSRRTGGEGIDMRILVVEDYELLRDSLTQGLREAGFTVDAAGDGETGLWQAKSADYDVIVLDL